MLHPLLVSPSPTGAILHRHTATGGDPLLAVGVNDLTEIPFLLRGTVSGPIAPYYPPPLEGAAGWRWKRREVGVIYKYRSMGNASDRGRGVLPVFFVKFF